MDDGVIDSVGSPANEGMLNGLRMMLVSLEDNVIRKTVLVSGIGTFYFINVQPGLYYLFINKYPLPAGASPMYSLLPSFWSHTGEKIGLGPGNDLNTNGKLIVNMGYECVYNDQFGIRYTTRNCFCMD